jgi:hypothetical protein
MLLLQGVAINEERKISKNIPFGQLIYQSTCFTCLDKYDVCMEIKNKQANVHASTVN